MQLICPGDRAALTFGPEGYSCSTCGRTYPVIDGVVRTLDRPDAFYEGAYENATRFVPKSEAWWHAWPLWLITNGYLWAVRRQVPAGSTVLELGCAGGVRYFGQRYRMIGCDLSGSALANTNLYACKIQADAAACIPLPDRSVDAVVSSYFWEHIHPDTKPRLLAEIIRVLRPGGQVVFVYDVETANPLIDRHRRRYPRIYARLFLEGDGHVGYQTPEENLALFRAAGLTVFSQQGLERTCLQSPSVYSKLAQFPGQAGPLLATLAGLGHGRLFRPYTALVRLVDALVCPRLPSGWARICLTVCQNGSGPDADHRGEN
jgi:SAM-dependent methyltransferase